jgi:hypothetical protein
MIALIVVSAMVLIATCIFGTVEGIRDAKHGTDPDHSKDFYLRLVIGAFVSSLLVRILLFRLLPYGTDWLDSKAFICSLSILFILGGMGGLYGFFLDISHNKSKGKAINYVGETADSDEWAKSKGRKNWVWEKLGFGLMFSLFYFLWVINALGYL